MPFSCSLFWFRVTRRDTVRWRHPPPESAIPAAVDIRRVKPANPTAVSGSFLRTPSNAKTLNTAAKGSETAAAMSFPRSRRCGHGAS